MQTLLQPRNVQSKVERKGKRQRKEHGEFFDLQDDKNVSCYFHSQPYVYVFSYLCYLESTNISIFLLVAGVSKH